MNTKTDLNEVYSLGGGHGKKTGYALEIRNPHLTDRQHM
jgi:hypothetical protein